MRARFSSIPAVLVANDALVFVGTGVDFDHVVTADEQRHHHGVLLAFDGVFDLLHAQDAALGIELDDHRVDALVGRRLRVLLLPLSGIEDGVLRLHIPLIVAVFDLRYW